MKGAVNAHRLGSAPISVGQIGERRLVTYGGVVDDDVQPPEVFRDRSNHRVDFGTLRDVGHNQQGVAAARRDLIHHGLAFIPADAYVHRHLRTRVGKRQRDGAPDVASRAGDQRDLAFGRCAVHGSRLGSQFGKVDSRHGA